MPKIVVSHTKTPEKEIKKALRELINQTRPEESIDELIRELEAFEDEYGMSTVEFYRQYLAGKIGDSAKVMAWAGAYEAYEHISGTH